MSQQTALTKSEAQPLVQSNRRQAISPACDIYENGDEVLVVADVPGVSADTLDVNVENSELTIVARRDVAEPSGSVLGTEYGDCDFRRCFTMPIGIDTSKIDAQLKDGVLWLHLPKSDALKPMQIPVHAG
jgi:HSP20 family molecular chaperone IbpA